VSDLRESHFAILSHEKHSDDTKRDAVSKNATALHFSGETVKKAGGTI